jgi:hypothetical protein
MGGWFMSMVGIMGFTNLIIILGLIAIGVYGFILFVKLAKRGIKALDIYIDEKTNNK